MSPIQTITTLRAGTMFSWEILGRNFVDVPTGTGSIRPHHTHMAIEDAMEHGWYQTLRRSGKPTIYIVRDIRDVLVSQFYFMVALNTDFHGFLHGRANPVSTIETGPTPPELYPCIQGRIRPRPIQAWLEHTQWIHEGWVDFYKFEDIKRNQKAFVEYLARRYNLKRKSSRMQYVKELVGVKPRKGIVGDWKGLLSEADHDYLWSIAGSRMEELGYERLH